MGLLRPCGLLVVLLALSLIACGESKRGQVAIEPADKDTDEKTDKDKEKDKGQEKDQKKDKDKGKFTDLAGIHAEVTALEVLHALDVNDAQLKLIGDLAGKTAQDAPARREIRVEEKYRTALLEFRAALRTGDDEKVEAASAALTEARQKDDPEYDPIEITDAARAHAPALFAKLNARQVVFYLSGLGDQFPDPTEWMLEALEESQNKKGKEWQAYRDDTAHQVGQLIGGLDAAKEQKARDRATLILDKAHDLSEKAFAEQKAQLQQSARDLVGKLGPLDIIRHHIERDLAVLLSNYRLAAAVEGRLKGK